MKILFILDLYPIQKDLTIPLTIENIALALKEAGFLINVIRPNFLFNTILRKHKIFKQGSFIRNGIKIYNRNFFLPFIKESNLFLKEILKEKYDLIISFMPSGNIYADLINKKLNLPHISILHYSDYHVLNDFKYSIYFKKRLKKALLNSTLIGARNSFLKEKLNADFVLPSFIEKENIVDEKKNKFENKLKIITLSKLIKRKNIHLVIEALKNAEFDFEYNIYGDGIEKENLKKLIKKHNLENKIKIHPYINHSEINSVLDKHDIFILPSKNETFGLCYLEAMARGLIVIAKQNEGMNEIIENNKNGFLINENEILEILKKLAENNDFKNEIIKNTLLNIQKYKKNNITKEFIKILKNYIKLN